MNGARILLVDDHELVREAMIRLFEKEAGITLAAACASVREALDIVSQQAIELVVLDYDLGEELGTEFLYAAPARGFHGPVLVLTGGLNRWAEAQLRSYGVAGIVLKTCPTTTLIRCIKLALAGQTCDSQSLLTPVAPTPGRPRVRVKEFTQRELQVLNAVVNGSSNKEIADWLSVSETSVKFTLQRLFKKTGVRTRSQLVRIALEDPGYHNPQNAKLVQPSP